jgi:hypothetical protein
VNHLPFEDWLLNDAPVTPLQQRELESHLRDCSYCAALAETGRMLRTVNVVAPAAGFTARFQARLAERKIVERRRRWLGAILFALGGLTLLMWITAPYAVSFMASPAIWISSVVGWVVFLETTLVALLEAGSVIINVIPKFLPPFVWMVLLSTLAGVGLLWSVSIWRFAHRGAPQGV